MLAIPTCVEFNAIFGRRKSAEEGITGMKKFAWW